LHFQGDFTNNVISNYKYSSTQARDFQCSSTQARDLQDTYKCSSTQVRDLQTNRFTQKIV